MARRSSDSDSLEFTRNFAARVRALRTERGWTQAELGTRIGVDGAVIRGYELGFHHPPLMTLRKLARIFGVSVDFLLNGEQAPRDGFRDRDLLELFLKADDLHHTAKGTLKQLIEALVVAEQTKRATSSNRSPEDRPQSGTHRQKSHP